MATIKKIIKSMKENIKLNNGQPIVAVLFQKNYKIIDVQSNLKREKDEDWNEQYKNHAEWIIMDGITKEDSLNLNLIITTTPCDYCANRIIENYNFKNVFYLFDKYYKRDYKYKEIEEIEKIDLKKTKFNPEMQKNIKIMEERWIESNLTNKRKTLRKKDGKI